MDGVKPEYKYIYTNVSRYFSRLFWHVVCFENLITIILNNKDECIFANYN